MSNQAIIQVNNLSKQYRLGEIGTGTMSHDVHRWWNRIRGKEDPFKKIGEINNRTKKGKSQYVWALKDINFEVGEGEIIGIIGRNGAGKSTLLKLLSKITAPTTGIIKAKGPVATLLEVGTGFHPELTGLENIYMNGTILGMTKVEIRRKLEEIIDFAGIARYVDTPVKRYSSGMTVRLGFAIAAHLEPRILIVDEVLAVGDAEFQKKAIGKMKDISQKEGRTVLFVSHNMGSVRQICQKGLLLNNGTVELQDDIETVVNQYINGFTNLDYYKNKETKNHLSSYFEYIKPVDKNRNTCTLFSTSESVTIEMKVRFNQLVNKEGIRIVIKDEKQVPIMLIPCVEFSHYVNNTEKEKVFQISLPANFFTQGAYHIDVRIHFPNVSAHEELNNTCIFTIEDTGSELAQYQYANYRLRGAVLPKYEVETIS